MKSNQNHFVISGVNSSPDPSPGVGLAKSLRMAFPEAKIVAHDYSTASTGIHHQIFDDFIIGPNFDDIDWLQYEAELCKAVQNGFFLRLQTH